MLVGTASSRATFRPASRARWSALVWRSCTRCRSGSLIGWYQGRLPACVSPLLEALRNTAALALLPVFILLLGIGEASKIALVIYVARSDPAQHHRGRAERRPAVDQVGAHDGARAARSCFAR